MTTKRLPTRHERSLRRWGLQAHHPHHLTREPIATLPASARRMTCNRCLGLGTSTEKKRVEGHWQQVDCVCPQCEGTGIVEMPA
jgi:RNase P subunit RPR2